MDFTAIKVRVPGKCILQEKLWSGLSVSFFLSPRKWQRQLGTPAHGTLSPVNCSFLGLAPIISPSNFIFSSFDLWNTKKAVSSLLLEPGFLLEGLKQGLLLGTQVPVLQQRRCIRTRDSDKWGTNRLRLKKGRVNFPSQTLSSRGVTSCTARNLAKVCAWSLKKSSRLEASDGKSCPNKTVFQLKRRQHLQD